MILDDDFEDKIEAELARTSDPSARIRELEEALREREEWIAAATRKISNAIGVGSELFTRHGEHFRLDYDFIFERITEHRVKYHEVMVGNVRLRKERDGALAKLREALEALQPFAVIEPVSISTSDNHISSNAFRTARTVAQSIEKELGS